MSLCRITCLLLLSCTLTFSQESTSSCCPNGYTCCKETSGSKSCCPEGFTCAEDGKCVQSLYVTSIPAYSGSCLTSCMDNNCDIPPATEAPIVNSEIFDNATCTCSGDPHCSTFDSQMIDYQGVCKHLLVKSTNPLYPQFSVFIKNAQRNDMPVSYANYLEIYYNEVTVRVWRNTETSPPSTDVYVATGYPPHDMKSAGSLKILPYITKDMQVQEMSGFIAVTTSFGLKAEYDGDEMVRVTVPAVYKNQVTGLCGNFDQVAENDLTTAEGKYVGDDPNSDALVGDSYILPSDPESVSGNCSLGEINPVDSCNPALKPFYMFSCSQLKNITGPFKDCIRGVGLKVAQGYYDNCVYDVCATSDYTSICKTYATFTSMCPMVDMENWRMLAGCENSTCTVSGDPHYDTYDDQMLDYQGVCKHLLVKSTNPLYPQFSVFIKNDQRNDMPVSYATYLEVYYNEVTVRVWRNMVSNQVQTEVYVAQGPPHQDMKKVGVAVSLPYNTNGLRVTESDGIFTISTAFGLKATYDGQEIVQVTLSSIYRSQVTGMCGNYDLYAENDLTTADGNYVGDNPNAEELIGNSYVTETDPEFDSHRNCTLGDINPRGSCNADFKPFYTSVCSQLINPTGPFKDCMDKVGSKVAQMYYDNCMYDVCATTDYQSICKTFETFSHLCPFMVPAGWQQTFGCASGTCIVSGDPHYHTCDGSMIHYQGTCKHLLVNSTNPALPQFSVFIRNEHRNSLHASNVKYVELFYNGMIVRIGRYLGGTKVLFASGTSHLIMEMVATEITFLPYILRDLEITLTDGIFSLETSFGLIVQYDGNNFAKVVIPATFTGKVDGMCGNFDHLDINDLTLADGTYVGDQDNSHSKIGNSYLVTDDPETSDISQCDVEDILPARFCDLPSQSLYSKACRTIMDTSGPLQNCIAVAGIKMASKFNENCMYDACATGDYKSICETFEIFLKLCPHADVRDWETLTKCGPGADISESVATAPPFTMDDLNVKHSMTSESNMDPVTATEETMQSKIMGDDTMEPFTAAEATVAPVTNIEVHVETVIPGETTMNQFTPDEETMGPFTLGEETMGPYTPEAETMGPFTPEVETMGPYTPEAETMSPYTPEAKTMGPYTPEVETMGPYTPEAETMSPYTPGEATMVPFTPEEKTMVPFTPEEKTMVPFTPEEKTMSPFFPVESTMEQLTFGQETVEPTVVVEETIEAYTTGVIIIEPTDTVMQEVNTESRYKGFQTCMIYGSLHYRTFDETKFNYHGTCRQLLVRTMDNQLPDQFTIHGRNKWRDGLNATLIWYIELQYNGFIVRLVNNEQASKLNVWTASSSSGSVDMESDGKMVSLPYNDHEMTIDQHDDVIILKTTFGLTITFDGWTEFISLPSLFSGKVAGMCGNYDHDPRNDLVTSAGMDVWEKSDYGSRIGNSFTEPDPENSDDGMCQSGDVPSECDSTLNSLAVNRLCSPLNNMAGPFSQCLAMPDAKQFGESLFSDCKTDACRMIDHESICRSLKMLDDYCQARGMSTSWKKETACDYSTCLITGDPHYLTYDQQLIHYQGTCKHLVSNSTSSAPEQFRVFMQHETRQGATLVSYPSYIELFYRNQIIRIWRRSASSAGSAAAPPSSSRSDSAATGTTPGVPEVWMASGSDHVNMEDVGMRLSTPYISDDFHITQSGSVITVKTLSGLSIQFDGYWTASVRMPSNFAGRVSGLCGNYDGSADNDLVNARGIRTTRHYAIGNSYITGSQNGAIVDSLCRPQQDFKPDCGKNQNKFSKMCSLLTDLGDVLGDCIKTLGDMTSQHFYDICMYDVCAGQKMDSACQTIDTFVQYCNANGMSFDMCDLPKKDFAACIKSSCHPNT